MRGIDSMVAEVALLIASPSWITRTRNLSQPPSFLLYLWVLQETKSETKQWQHGTLYSDKDTQRRRGLLSAFFSNGLSREVRIEFVKITAGLIYYYCCWAMERNGKNFFKGILCRRGDKQIFCIWTLWVQQCFVTASSQPDFLIL